MYHKGLFILLFLAGNVFSQNLVPKVIELNYVQADNVIKLIQPLLDEQERVSGSEHTLVVKVLPQTLTQLRVLLHQIDVPPVSFKISVYQGDPDWLRSQNSKAILYRTKNQSEMLRGQSIVVMSTKWAFIANDQEMPVLSAVGDGWVNGVAYQQHHVRNGLFLQPVLQGSLVKLTVKRVRQQVNPAGGQQFDNQNLNTTLMVPINKWVALGSAQELQNRGLAVIDYSAGSVFAQNSTLYIKIKVMNTMPSGETK